MSKARIVVSVFAKDRPGVIDAVSDVIVKHKASWMESSLSRLCGQFAGLVHVEVEEDALSNLEADFHELKNQGIHVTQLPSDGINLNDDAEVNMLGLLVEANDRPGIVQEIADALGEANINIESLETGCESASMAGYNLFRAHLWVSLPEDMTEEDVESLLETVSDDLMVAILEEE